MKAKRAFLICLCISAMLCSCARESSSADSSLAEAPSSISEPASSSDPSESGADSDEERFDIKQAVDETILSSMGLLSQDDSFSINEQTVGEDIASLYDFTNKTGCYPVYKNMGLSYYPFGEQAFEEMLSELEKANDFIFLEYFIINEGEMWDRLFDVLKRKAAEGVEVRLLYDGLMDGTSLPEDFPKMLEDNGIKCHVFSSLKGSGSLNYNTRDHRKILVIDGKTAFTGGINIADEYINLTHPYGVWKDNAIKITGDAVNSFTLMFLQIWCAYEDSFEYEGYIGKVSEDRPSDGYIMPFSDDPFDKYSVAKSFYMSILETAKEYVYIFTPYLLPDTELEEAIKNAAERGVDVRIYVPGIPDKQYVNMLTKSHYRPLIGSGVRIFEYNKGFVHSKVFVSDDIKAIVGTINLDNRSLVYHFECGAYIYASSVIEDIKNDFTSHSEDFTEITADDIDAFSEAGGYLLKSIEGFL